MSIRESMKAVIPHWQNRVSPVFDAASRVILVEVTGGHESERTDLLLQASDPAQRAEELAQLGTDVLICGAISRPLESAILSAGIQVIPHVCGYVNEVVQAYLDQRLSDPVFLMPGCCGRRRRTRAGRGRGRFVEANNEQPQAFDHHRRPNTNSNG